MPTAPSASTVPGAASLAVRDLVSGHRRSGRVVAVFPSCAYADVAGRLVAVEAAGGLRLPCSVVLAGTARSRPLAGLRAGQPVESGGGGIRLGPLTVRVGRWWAPASPRSARPRASWRAPGADCAGWDALALGWLGRGPGLTPAGDDLLAGLLVGLAGRPDLRDPLAAAVLRHAPPRTTWLSAELLRLAADGLAAPAVVRVADALAGHGPAADLDRATAALLAVGHTSGAALARGLLLAARTDLRHPRQEGNLAA
jgi:hypothetical protein